MAPKQFNAPSSNHEGPRSSTLGVVLHSTRGQASTFEEEFQATLNWFNNTTSEVSAHAVIAADGTIANVVDPSLIAWHCREMNRTHLGVELVQPNKGDRISDAQYASLAWWLAGMSKRFGFPLTSATLPEHWETVPGRRDGKSDIEAPFDKARLLGLIGDLG